MLKYFYIQALKYQYNLPQLGISHYLSVFPGFFFSFVFPTDDMKYILERWKLPCDSH